MSVAFARRWRANDAGQLRAVLDGWGTLGPPRLDRQKRKAEFEALALRRLLLARLSENSLAFPLAVQVVEPDPPDVLVQEGDRIRLVERTSACDDSEQQRWTRRDKAEARLPDGAWLGGDRAFDDGPIVGSVAERERFESIGPMMRRAIVRKGGNPANRGVELLIHLNTTRDTLVESGRIDPDDWSRVFAAIGGLPSEAQAFPSIWLVRANGVAELGSRRVVGESCRVGASPPANAAT